MAQSDLEKLARELLDKYRSAEESLIFERSTDLKADLEEIAREAADYEAKIELAARGG